MADEFLKFPKVGNFGNTVTQMKDGSVADKVVYGGKVKLHGTNGAVRIYNGRVTAQKRNSDIAAQYDGFKFAEWVASTANAWASKNASIVDDAVVVFGEWAGRGIQGGSEDAVEQVEPRQFFVFGVMTGGKYLAEPSTISRYVPDIPRVHVIPWLLDPTDSKTTVHFSRGSTLASFAEHVNETVEQVDAEDPYIYSLFGIKGRGEGVVMVPVSVDGGDVAWSQLSSLIFKAKSARHRSRRTKRPPCTVKEPPPEGIDDFVEQFVTDARCAQGVHEACDGVLEKSRLNAFYQWVRDDVRDESEAEVRAMNVEWKVVSKHVSKAAVRWFLRECKRQ